MEQKRRGSSALFSSLCRASLVQFDSPRFLLTSSARPGPQSLSNSSFVGLDYPR